MNLQNVGFKTRVVPSLQEDFDPENARDKIEKLIAWSDEGLKSDIPEVDKSFFLKMRSRGLTRLEELYRNNKEVL